MGPKVQKLTASTPAVGNPSSPTFGVSSDLSVPSTINETSSFGNRSDPVPTPVVQKMTTIDLVLQAIETVGVPRKGASYLSIQKWIISNKENVVINRLKANLKKAITKALETGLLKRPTVSKNVTGLRGFFMKNNVLVAKNNPAAKTAKKLVKKAKEIKKEVVTNTVAAPKPKAVGKPKSEENTAAKPKPKTNVKPKPATKTVPSGKPKAAAKPVSGKDVPKIESKKKIASKVTSAADTVPKPSSSKTFKVDAGKQKTTKIKAHADGVKLSSQEGKPTIKRLNALKGASKTADTVHQKHLYEFREDLSDTEQNAEPGPSNDKPTNKELKAAKGVSKPAKSTTNVREKRLHALKEDLWDTEQNAEPEPSKEDKLTNELKATKAVSKPAKTATNVRQKRLHAFREDLSDTEQNAKPGPSKDKPTNKELKAAKEVSKPAKTATNVCQKRLHASREDLSELNAKPMPFQEGKPTAKELKAAKEASQPSKTNHGRQRKRRESRKDLSDTEINVKPLRKPLKSYSSDTELEISKRANLKMAKNTKRTTKETSKNRRGF